MNFFTEFLKFEHLELAPTTWRQQSLFQIWRQHKGIMHRDIIQHIDHLCLLNWQPKEQAPLVTFSGNLSLTNFIAGEGWQKEMPRVAGVSEIFEAYEAAASGLPAFEYVSFNGDRQGETFDLGYERLVLPFKTPSGLPQIVTLSTGIRLQINGENADFYLRNSQSNQAQVGPKLIGGNTSKIVQNEDFLNN